MPLTFLDNPPKHYRASVLFARGVFTEMHEFVKRRKGAKTSIVNQIYGLQNYLDATVSVQNTKKFCKVKYPATGAADTKAYRGDMSRFRHNLDTVATLVYKEPGIKPFIDSAITRTVTLTNAL